jgi:hypothetical protein
LLIFILLPGVMWAGTELKRKMKTEARPVQDLERE